jgi:predicted nuclease with TOPRIM domain
MYGLAQIYDEAKYDLHDLLSLHRLAKERGMKKQDIIKLLELIKHNELETLQSKAESLRYEINMLEIEKTKAMHRIFRLKRMIYELESSLAQKREMALMSQESGKYDNSGNLYPVPYSEPDTSSHSIRISSYTKE